jgi:hypothetical protein
MSGTHVILLLALLGLPLVMLYVTVRIIRRRGGR